MKRKRKPQPFGQTETAHLAGPRPKCIGTFGKLKIYEPRPAADLDLPGLRNVIRRTSRRVVTY